MNLRAFLRRRREYIRARVFNSRRGIYFLSDGGLDREAAKGAIFAAPFLLAATERASLFLLLLLGVPAAIGGAYAAFVLYVGWSAYIQRSDTQFDKHTKYLLPPEYSKAESSTKAKRRRAKATEERRS